MKSHIVKLSALGIAGMIAMSGTPTQIQAKQIISTEKSSLAGEEISSPSGVTGSSISMVEAGSSATLDGVNAVVIEDPILNIKYDRLGIANVKKTLNVRAKAKSNAKIVGKMGKNAACNIEKVTKDGWAKIKSGDVKGYVKTDALIMDEEAEELALKVGKKIAIVKTTTLNARFLPSTQSSKYTLIPIGEELEVVKENISEKYVNSFIKKNFTDKKAKATIKGVNKDDMANELTDWLCVSVDDEKVFVAKEFVSIAYDLKRAYSTTTNTNQTAASTTEKGSDQKESVRSSMVAFAKQYLGNRYVYGGTSLTNGIDCSGFTMRIYEHFGYSIPRTSSAQAAYTTTIAASEAKPGDLFFYGNGSSVSHVAMYIGGGQVIHASNERTGIKISNAYYRTPIKVGRVIK